MIAVQRESAILPTTDGEETCSIHIDTAAIPSNVRDDLAAATMDLIHSILRQPGGREALDARIAANRAASAAR